MKTMKSPEQYVPSPDEMKKVAESMTPRQEELSQVREETLQGREAEKISKNAGERDEARQRDLDRAAQLSARIKSGEIGGNSSGEAVDTSYIDFAEGKFLSKTKQEKGEDVKNKEFEARRNDFYENFTS